MPVGARIRSGGPVRLVAAERCRRGFSRGEADGRKRRIGDKFHLTSRGEEYLVMRRQNQAIDAAGDHEGQPPELSTCRRPLHDARDDTHTSFCRHTADCLHEAMKRRAAARWALRGAHNQRELVRAAEESRWRFPAGSSKCRHHAHPCLTNSPSAAQARVARCTSRSRFQLST
jgi:hypothetical protein